MEAWKKGKKKEVKKIREIHKKRNHIKREPKVQ